VAYAHKFVTAIQENLEAAAGREGGKEERFGGPGTGSTGVSPV
jgi:hypothetical protein